MSRATWADTAPQGGDTGAKAKSWATLPLLLAGMAACAPEVKVMEVHGEVVVNGRMLKVGDEIPAHAPIEVKDGTLSLAIEHYGIVRLLPASRMRLAARRTETEIVLSQGTLWCDLHPLEQRHFFVRSQHGVVRAVGTEFLVQTDDERTEARVISGTVTIATSAAPQQRVTVAAHQRAALTRDTAPSTPQPYDPAEDRDTWQRLSATAQDAGRLLRQAGRVLKKSVERAAPEIREGLRKGGAQLKRGFEHLMNE